MGNNGKPWLNNSGCPDPTAYAALKNLQREEAQADHDVRVVITTIKNILDLSGFDLVGRIQLRHKKTGKFYK